MKTKVNALRSEYNLQNLYLPVSIFLIMGFLLFGSSTVFAQTGTATTTVAVSNATPLVGTQVTVAISIDLTSVNSPNNLLGSYTGSLNWNTAVLSYQSYSGAPPVNFTGSVNTGSTGSGQITFNGANASGAAGVTNVINITFNVVGAGNSPLDLAYSAMAAANTFNSLLGILTVNDSQVNATTSAGSISYIGDIGSNTIKNSSTADLVITTTAAVSAGNDIVIAYATDPTQDLNIAITDAAGNRYQQAAMSISSGNVRTYIFAAYNVNALPGGSAITITQTVYSTTTVAARAAVVSVFSGLANSGALEQTSVASAAGSTSPASGAATTVFADQLLIGAVGTEGPGSDAAGTWSNSFTAGPRAGSTATTTDAEVTISMGWRIVSAAGSYTAAKSGITSRDYAAAIATFKTTDAGISYIGDIGRTQVKTAGTSIVITTNAAVTAGDEILVMYAADEEGTISSVVDGAGNTYAEIIQANNDQSGTAGGVRTHIYAAYNVNALASGSTITINHSSITARSATASVFRGLASIAVVDQTKTATGTTSTVSTGATSTTTMADELLVGVVGLEGPNVDAPSLWQNTFTYGPRFGTSFGASSGDATDITVQMGWRIVGATGAYTAQLANLNTTRDWAAGLVTLKAGSAIPPVQYTITVTSGTNGNISPTGPVLVTQGNNQNFFITPSPGYRILSVLVDGSPVGNVSSYTFNNVQTNHSIEASFEEIPAGSIAYLGDIGSVYADAAGTTLSIPVGPAGVAVGNTIVVGFASRGASTYNQPTLADGAGNTYNMASVGVTYSHGRSYIYYAYVEHALTNGQNITITTSSVGSRVAVASVFSGLASVNPLDQALGFPDLADQETAQGNSPSVGPTGTTTQANELIIGMVGTEDASSSADAGTGTWMNDFIAGPTIKTSSGASNLWRVSMGYKIVSSAATFTAAKTVTNNPYWAAAIATFKTVSTLSPSSYSVLLGRPTASSITVNAIMANAGDVYFEYGTSSGNYSTGQTGSLPATATEPVETIISGLSPNTKYFYRLRFRPTGSTSWASGNEYSFHTQRAKNETFSFTLISDSHLGETFSGNTAARYNQTTLNVATDRPDFHIDLGDCFIMNTPTNQTGANNIYKAQRPYFGNFSNSSPVFLAIGNHELESGWNLDDTPFSKALASITARKQYFLNPKPDAFYSGNTDLLPALGGDQFREDYYSWEWGDALFIVLDPFQYTMTKPYGTITGSGEDDDETVSGDQWNWTLGQQQFNWFKQTLENSTARYKFVFSHHVTGGILTVSGAAGTPNYVRGGAEAAPYFEWGGKNANGTEGFNTKRPGWSDMPVHQLMVANGVTAYFHGHDHQFVHEERDGVVYQLVPSPGMDGYGFDLYDNSPYAISGGNLPDPGHVRVTVSPENALVEYVRSQEGGGGVNGQVAYSYTMEGAQLTPEVTVTLPNGGENWQAGSNHNITWTSAGLTGNVHIEYSSNNGSNWTDVIASTANSGSYAWTIPNTISSSCIVRVSDLDGTPSDVSDAVFTISPVPVISVTSPNGSENWQVGSIHNITWTSTGIAANVHIEYSTNNGSNWTDVIASTANSGSYSWTIPNTISVNCIVRVSDLDGTPSDVSNAVFTISPVPVISVTSPTGGENWQAGSNHNITWTSAGLTGNVHIEYSINNGSNWTDVIASTANGGSYAWTIPNTTSANCIVRVSDLDGTPSDVSDAVFTISPVPVISVTSPDGGENWQVGSIHNITWTSTGIAGNVHIEYSTNNGSNWTDIIASTANGGSYSWTIPNMISSNCIVRVSDLDGTPSDVSNAVFVISQIPAIALLSPNGGEDWKIGSTRNITWTSAGTSGNVHIEYSTNNGTAWTDVTASTADDGAFSWTIPDAPSVNCIVRVSDTDGSPSDNSNSVFTISAEPDKHFIPVWSTNGLDHMNFYALTATLDGVDLQPGDEIGIFDGTYCVGSGKLTQVLNGVINLEIRVSRDDPDSPATDGYTAGHTATFKIWDASGHIEISAVQITYETGYNNIFEAGASSWYHIGGTSSVTQEITLSDGWSIFSLYVTPENTDMQQIVKPLIDAGTLVKVQNESGAALEKIPGTSTWINKIENWSNTEGYKIRVSAISSLIVSGIPITDPVAISLLSGWNIISYPVSVPGDAMQILNNLILSGILVKVQDQAGSAIEQIPNTTNWINKIGNFDPDEGYKVRVSGDGVLNIIQSGSGTKGALSTVTTEAATSYYKPAWTGNGLDHMNFYFAEIQDGEAGLEPGDEIGIFDGSYCVGSAVIREAGEKFYSFVASADDPTTPETDGFIKGHSPGFKVWRPSTNTEISIGSFEYFPGSSKVFEPMGTAAISLNTSELGLNNDFGIETSLGGNYPNPFTEETTIPFVIGRETTVDIAIYDIQGVKVCTLVHGNYPAGSYQTTWNTALINNNGISSGVYYCKMVAGNKVFVKTIILR